MPEFGFDEWIDAQLRKVPLPPNLLTRLAESGPAGLADDAQMDAELCRVEVPAHLESRLRRIPRRGPPPLWRQVGLAASFFLMIGLLGIGYLGLLTGTFSPGRSDLADKSAPTVEGSRAVDRDVAASPSSPTTRANRQGTQQRTGPARVTSRDSQLASLPTAAASQADTSDKRIVVADTRAQTALGASGTLDRGPELETLDVPRMRGIVPPVIRGYDMLFQLKYGEHPFVTPSADKSFLTTSLPFALATASFDMALGAVRSGRLPLPDEIRIEEFLAALDYPLPRAPASGLALHVAGSASPLGNGAAAAGRGSLHMLQLAVQAASFDAHAHSPNRLVVALDMSSQMRSGARIEGVRRALAKLADHMGDRDRVTLVRFAEQSSVLAEAATGAELKSLIASDDLAAPGGAANLMAAIESAADAAGGESLDPRQLVVITADRGNFDPAALPKATRQLGALAERNIPWQIIRVAADDNDAHWGQLASAARGKVAAARAGRHLHRAARSHDRLANQSGQRRVAEIDLQPTSGRRLPPARARSHDAHRRVGRTAVDRSARRPDRHRHVRVVAQERQHRDGRFDRIDVARSQYRPADAHRAANQPQTTGR